MHLAVIKEDLSVFIHAHPEGAGAHMGSRGSPVPLAQAHGVEEAEPAGAEDEDVSFHVTFPEPGNYKLFAQFRPQGAGLPAETALTASFWVRVVAETPAAVSSKVLYTIISLLLIALLSWGTSRFLKAKSSKV